MQNPWESEIAAFLGDLLEVQEETLDSIRKRRELMARSDREGLLALNDHEAGIVGRLQDCLTRRQALLDRAGEEGLPSKNLGSLAKSLPRHSRDELHRPIREATARTRLLKTESLINWVVIQKTLIHLSQMLEIIATKGRGNPTYEKREAMAMASGGALVDQEA